jgi:hypothetical protein
LTLADCRADGAEVVMKSEGIGGEQSVDFA